MKAGLARIGISLALAAMFVSARPPATASMQYAVFGMQVGVTWLEAQQHDFGTLRQGRPAAHRFVFKNTGTQPLIIDNVRTPCGCTAVEWPEAPIAPGDTAAIVVEYNAAQTGYFYKVIKVFFRGIRGGNKLVVEGSVE